ncbi:Putative nucleoside transporter yegT [Cedecea neteri]|uniref:Nucleoside transporter yegT n=1 Tax=Cedecea neteri TaxID=158822 RepID=A0A2X3IVZ8_9ENTR|nr:Putative nucleoside transporter yegT [Cedecea neteri]
MKSAGPTPAPPSAAILSPILVGSLTDRFFAAQKVLALLMFVGAGLMYLAAQQTEFVYFFPLLLAYSLTYMPTIALTNQHRVFQR